VNRVALVVSVTNRKECVLSIVPRLPIFATLDQSAGSATGALSTRDGRTRHKDVPGSFGTGYGTCAR
jgi:hypothetical protein